MIIGDHMFTEAKEYAEAAYEMDKMDEKTSDEFLKEICELEKEFLEFGERWISFSKRLYTK